MKSLKKIIFAVCLLAAGSLFAAGDQWLTDFEAAKKEAAEKKLPILVDFSGSDWCGWCIRLDKEVFAQKEFKEYAKNNFVLLLLDFPRRKEIPAELKKQNSNLAKKYQVQGFPTVLILDKDGKEIKRTGYMKGGAKAYVKHLKKIKKELKL